MRVALRSGTLLLLLHHVGSVKPGASHPTPLLYMRSPRWTEKPVTRAPLHQHGDVWNPEASLGRSDTPRPMPSPRQQAATLPWRQDAYSTASPYPWPVSFPITFHSNRKKGIKSRHCLSCPPERESLSLTFLGGEPVQGMPGDLVQSWAEKEGAETRALPGQTPLLPRRMERPETLFLGEKKTPGSK